MTPETGERPPAADGWTGKAPAARRAWVQQALGVLVLLFLLSAVSLWLFGMRVTAVVAIIAVICVGMMFLDGIGGRHSSSKGPRMRKLSRLILGRTAQGPTSPQQEGTEASGGLLQENPPRPQRGRLQLEQGQIPPEQGQLPSQQGQIVPQQNHFAPQQYPPGTQGHPAGWPKGQDRPDALAAQEAGAVPPAPVWNIAPLPEPPVFAGRSTPGQTAWLLPVSAAPSGLAADGIRLGDLDVRAASVVGAGHRCQEPAIARQDAYALGRTKSGHFLVVAIADGVGQSRHSDLAARVAVSAATRELTRFAELPAFPNIDTGLLYTKIAGEMVGTGRDRGIPDADVCAILITAVIPTRPRSDGTRPVWTSWIGDVSLWISREGELRRCTGHDKSGLDRNALHAVLPFNPDQVEERVFELLPNDRVALMTDGVSDSLDSVTGTLDYFARQWAGPPPHPAAFLHGLCYDGPGQTDDRTAVVVWCNAPGPGNHRVPGERR